MRLGRGLAALAVAAFLTGGAARAQGRGEEQPTPLRFAPGRPCIDYRGRASIFTLHLDAGQRIVATATGLAYYGVQPGGGRALTTREVGVSLHGNFETAVKLDTSSQGEVPATGAYDIDLSPESEAGNPGELLICKVQEPG